MRSASSSSRLRSCKARFEKRRDAPPARRRRRRRRRRRPPSGSAARVRRLFWTRRNCSYFAALIASFVYLDSTQDPTPHRTRETGHEPQPRSGHTHRHRQRDIREVSENLIGGRKYAKTNTERELNTIIFMNTELNTGVIKVFELEYPGYKSIRARILVPAQTPLFVNTIPTISHMNTLLPWLLSS